MNHNGSFYLSVIREVSLLLFICAYGLAALIVLAEPGNSAFLARSVIITAPLFILTLITTSLQTLLAGRKNKKA